MFTFICVFFQIHHFNFNVDVYNARTCGHPRVALIMGFLRETLTHVMHIEKKSIENAP